MIRSWVQRAKHASTNLPNGEIIFDAYSALLTVVWRENWTGACHDTSALLYMLLSELGCSPTLVTGEVKAPAGIFDHSWVELDSKIYDVAIGFPGEDGHYVGPSVFASLNIDTGEPTELTFGVRSPTGLDDVGRFVAHSTLDEYSKIQNVHASIWALTPIVASICGLSLTSEDLRGKYGNVMRQIRGQEACP